MSLHLTNPPRHAAPRAPRFQRLTRCVEAVRRSVTLVAQPWPGASIADAVPSMELPAGHMQQRPVMRMLAPGEGRIVPALASPDAPTAQIPTVTAELLGGAR